MGRGWIVWTAAIGAGCGIDDSTFTIEYVDAYCVYYLACSDPALEVFDGIDTPEECEAVYGPAVTDSALTCKLDKKAAKVCLESLDGLACPSEGYDVDGNLPSECAQVWTDCQTAEEEG
jgi:hypothetical protein